MGVAEQAVRPVDRTVDGVVPARVVRPETTEALAAAIADAHAKREAVVLWGGGTRIGVGDPPERYDIAVELGGLRGIVEHSPSDLVCTVRAGTTLAELDRVLAASGQRWPVEAPCPERATVGGTIAGAAVGPSRLRYQHPRDWIIGCRAVLGDGTLTKAGGRVVKNVTGYDLTRLYSGSYGTLVALAEITLKLVALPERTLTLRAEVPDVSTGLRLAADLRETRLPLDALAIVTGPAAQAMNLGGAGVFVRVAGPDAAVERIAGALRDAGLTEADPRAWMRIATIPVEVDEVARAAWPAGHQPPYGLDLSSAVVYPANGIAFLLAPIAPDAFRDMRMRLVAGGGALVVERAGADHKRAVGGAWGPSAVPHGIARALKERFDPRGVLAPGRVPLASS